MESINHAHITHRFVIDNKHPERTVEDTAHTMYVADYIRRYFSEFGENFTITERINLEVSNGTAEIEVTISFPTDAMSMNTAKHIMQELMERL